SFWLAAASPAFVHSTVIWAHALSAGLGGLAVIAALRVARQGVRSWAGLALGASLALGALVRSEGILLALAVAGVAGILRVRRNGPAAGAAAAALCGGVAAGVLAAEARWRSAITAGQPAVAGFRQTSTSTPFVLGRLAGAWHELVDPALWNQRAVAV